MILLLLLLVVLVAAAAAGLLGIGVLSDDRRQERSGGLLALVSAPVVLVVGALLLAGLVLGVSDGGGGGGGGDAEEPARPPRTASTPTSLPVSRVQTSASPVTVVRLRAADDDRFSAYDPVSGLTPGAVVRILAEGFGWQENGRIAQCVSELGRQTACAESFPVQFDDDGRADFQIAVQGDVAPGGCRVGQPTCLLRLTGDSGRHATVQTVLVDRLGPAAVRVEPARGITDGQTVEVSVAGFPAGTTATAVLCAPPEAYDARRCASPDAGATFTVDARGAGRTSLVVASGRLGADAVLCGPRRACGIAVVVGSGFVTASPASVGFSLGPGVAYDAGRLVPGLILALVLVGAAVVIARRTDWTKPTEAATPALDGADLRADQNLDDLFGTDEELDARDPIPW